MNFRMVKNAIVDQYFNALQLDQVVYLPKEKEREEKNAQKILI